MICTVVFAWRGAGGRGGGIWSKERSPPWGGLKNDSCGGATQRREEGTVLVTDRFCKSVQTAITLERKKKRNEKIGGTKSLTKCTE